MSPEEKKLEVDSSLIKNLGRLSANLTFNGQLSGSDDLEISGSFTGSIEIPLHDLTIQRTGRVKAEVVKAKNLFLHGQLEGLVKAERVVISETGIFSGEIITSKISVQNGARFKGSIKITKDYHP
ncbi:MAG: polymer-forming cytoskeletal protein [Candidatus Aminicenantes bacterium]|nr:polymer-forming cytoskeletal protein [Candidatus Aminicenantes bacterium]